jgi:teichoic acid transport system ATP-binding protein
MLDFMTVVGRSTKGGPEVGPKFLIKKSKDLMIRGGDFYAVWDEEQKMWSTDEDDIIRLVDDEIRKFLDKNSTKYPTESTHIKFMWDSDSGSIDKWHKYCQKQMRDSYSMLDEELIFSNTELTRDKHASKKLKYPLEEGSITAYDKLISTLYTEEERHKLEWAIGSIVSGDSKTIQKFMVLYGAAGTGKSTILKMITGVTFPSSGAINVNGRVSALLELTSGFDQEFSGRENIYLKGHILGLKDSEIKALEDTIIEFSELEDYIDQPVRTYSSGMKSRLGFAINVNIRPEILIVDEALSVGDAAFKNKCKEKVNDIIKNDNVTLLFVTHQTAVAEEFCKRGIVMKNGKLVFDGEVSEASKKYNELYKKKKK